MNGMFKDKNKRVNPSTHCCSLFFFQSRKKKNRSSRDEFATTKIGWANEKKKIHSKISNFFNHIR